MVVDPNFANVSLLLHGDGVSGSKTFVDVTGKTMTAVGDAQISTVQSKFGGASIGLGGAGYVTTPNTSAFDLSARIDFTIEAWINVTNFSTYRGIVCAREDGGTAGWSLYIDASSGLLFSLSSFSRYSDGATTLLHNTPIVAGVWTHIAWVKTFLGYNAYINGIKGQLLAVTSGLQYTPLQPVAVGVGGSGGTLPFLGFIDEVRITKGFARYTASFTPQTSAFPDYLAQVTGVVLDSTATPCARTVRLVRRDTGALLSSVVSNATTGAYELGAPTLNEVVRIVHSNTTAAPFENDLIDRVIPA